MILKGKLARQTNPDIPEGQPPVIAERDSSTRVPVPLEQQALCIPQLAEYGSGFRARLPGFAFAVENTHGFPRTEFVKGLTASRPADPDGDRWLDLTHNLCGRQARPCRPSRGGAEDRRGAGGSSKPPCAVPLPDVRTLASLGILTELGNRRFALTHLGEALKTGAPGSARTSLLTIGSPWFNASFDQFIYSLQTGETGFEKANGMPLFASRSVRMKHHCSARP